MCMGCIAGVKTISVNLKKYAEVVFIDFYTIEDLIIVIFNV